jgi:hypothetical protein
MTHIHHFLFRLLVYFKGINFFKIDDMSEAQLVSTGTFIVGYNKSISFRFYKKSYEDIVYKRGYIRPETFIGYMVECNFDYTFPQSLREFNNLKFVLKKNKLFSNLKEENILHFLIEFYIDYIRHNLSEDNEDSKFLE